MEKKKRKFAVPHVYILMMFIILFFSILSYIIPANVYDMQTIEVNGVPRDVIDPDSYHAVESTPVTLLQLLTSIPRGMQEVAQIIFFIFVVGGAMTVLQETRAIEAGMGRMIKALKGASIVIVPIVMFLFSLMGAIAGMAEETLAFIPLFVAMMMAAGYDSLVGVAVVLAGAGIGFSAAFINPFTIQVAQGIAQLELLSGMGFRIVMYAVMLVLTIGMVMRYAMKVKKNPELSPVRDIDKQREDVVDLEALPPFGAKQIAILIVFLISVILIVVGVIKWGFYMDEIAAIFLAMSIITACIDRMGFNHYAEVLGKGMADIAGGALVVGFARAILVVMTDGNILHTILHAAAGLLGGLPKQLCAIGMYIFQCLLNFLVPSGSGQAAVSMPIMAPLSDLVGVSRQTAVIAFQLGDGISNIFTPTSGYFMAGLALAKIPWTKWAKWFLPILIMQYAVGAIFVIIAASINLQ